MLEMQLISVSLLDEAQENVVVLRERGGNRVLALSVGTTEAASIAMALEGVKVPRPMTHDLLAQVIRRLQGQLARVIIHDLKDDTFIGQLDIQTDYGVMEVDARASDAIAIAVRTGAPVFVADAVMEEAGVSSKMIGTDYEDVR